MSMMGALLRKEAIQIVRDPSALLAAISLPLILMLLFGYALNLDRGRPRVGLVIEESGEAPDLMASAILGSRYFQATAARSRQELYGALSAGDLRGLVAIEAGFQRAVLSGLPAKVQIITDGTEPNSAALLRGYASGALAAGVSLWPRHAGASGNQAALVSSQARFWYNPELKSRDYLVPGSLALCMTLVGVLLTAMIVSRERESGVLEAIGAAGASMGRIIMAKLLSYYVLAMLSALFAWGVAVYWFEVPFRGSPLALAALATAYLMGALGQGLLISTLAGSQFMSAQLAVVTGFLPTLILSGLVFEIRSAPAAIQLLSQLVPARHLVPCLHAIFLTGDVWPLFGRSIAAMLALAGCFLIPAALAGARRLR